MSAPSPERAYFPQVAGPSDLARCAALLRNGSLSFHAASLLLPRAARDSATALYAFCRVADDAVDLSADPSTALVGLRRRLDVIYGGEPDEPIDRAVAEVVRRHALPREAFEALFEGFAWDAGRRSFDSQRDTIAYAVRVAGTVGVMMALIMGARSAQALARAADLGIAMQLTNIARDVGEDARAGRLYLPRQWLKAEGLDPDRWLAEPSCDHRIVACVGRLLSLADHYYTRAASGIALLPAACRPAIRAARLIYREIGCAVERQGCDSVSRRAYVPTRRKLALMARAWLAHPEETSFRQEPADPEALFLIHAARQPLGQAAPPPLAWGDGFQETNFRSRALLAFNILERSALRSLGRGGER